MKKNEPPRPIDIDLLGANGVMPHANLLPHTVQQAWGLRGRAHGEWFGIHPQNLRLPKSPSQDG